MRPVSRRFPIGAELQEDGGVHFRVWAPGSPSAAVELEAEPSTVTLEPEGGGYFSGFSEHAGSGTRYRIRLADGVFPDPASRFQPEGPHGASAVIDPAFAWTDQRWRGRAVGELAIYELHLGTFTLQGTWRAAMERLPYLRELGITMVEVMPIADFPGQFGWGYDGVNLFAPSRVYGAPQDAKAFVDAAHALGLAVILDVVYNHLGPDGNYLGRFTPDLVSRRYKNEWGDALNFDGHGAAGIREFFVTNAAYWISEYHFDGLRLDATQQMHDASPRHLLAELTQAARAAAGERQIYVVAENETQEARLVRPTERGGYGMDAIWNDDFHHAALVAATGRAEAYFSGYRGTAQEFLSAAKHGFLYQGQWYRWQRKRRGTPSLNLSPRAFVWFLENHDQVSNSLRGRRLHQLTSPSRLRALTALLLLGPATPMLFQGQEFNASSPFVYFADHEKELARAVREGRAKFLMQFPSVASAGIGWLADPGAVQTRDRCRIDWSELERNAAAWQLHADLLRLRAATAAFADPARLEGAVLGTRAFVLRMDSPEGDRMLLVNLGPEVSLAAVSEPLLAAPDGSQWELDWSSEDPRYDGGGAAPVETTANWFMPGECAAVMRPGVPRELPDFKFSEKD